MRKYLLFGLIIFMLATSVSAYDEIDTITVDSNSLPFSGTFDLALNFTENHTIYLAQYEDNANLEVMFPSEVFFDGVSEKVVKINYTVLKHDLIVDKILVDAFNLTNSYNNNSATYATEVTVIANNTISLDSVNSFSINPNGHTLNVSWDLLPVSGEAKFRVNGDGDYLNFSNCDEWLQCPDVTMLTNGTSVIDLAYTVPYTAELGTRIATFDLIGNNTNMTVNVTFNVVSPKLSIPESSLDRTECLQYWDDQEAFDNCIAEKQALENEYYAQLLALAKSKQSNYTKEVEVEKIVMAGSVDEELKVLYDSCMSERDRLEEQYNSCSLKREDLISEKQQFDNMLSSMEEDISLREANIADAKNNLEEQRKERVKKTIMWFMFISGLGGGLIFFVRRDMQLNHWGFGK